MGCSHATEIAMRIGSQTKEPRSRYCSFSFTNNSAGPSPTASFTIDPLQHHGPTANSNRPSIKPTTPSKTSSNSYKLHELVEVFLFTNETVRIYSTSGEFADLIIFSPPYAEQRKDTYGGIPEEDYPNWM